MGDIANKELLYGGQDEAQQDPLFTETKKIVPHYRLEGRLNSSSIKKIKKILSKNRGCFCWACGFNFAKKYKNIADDFIEAHHDVPYSDLVISEKREVKPKDFILLCSNCHRMIHRLKEPTLDNLKQRIVS